MVTPWPSVFHAVSVHTASRAALQGAHSVSKQIGLPRLRVKQRLHELVFLNDAILHPGPHKASPFPAKCRAPPLRAKQSAGRAGRSGANLVQAVTDVLIQLFQGVDLVYSDCAAPVEGSHTPDQGAQRCHDAAQHTRSCSRTTRTVGGLGELRRAVGVPTPGDRAIAVVPAAIAHACTATSAAEDPSAPSKRSSCVALVRSRLAKSRINT